MSLSEGQDNLGFRADAFHESGKRSAKRLTPGKQLGHKVPALGLVILAAVLTVALFLFSNLATSQSQHLATKQSLPVVATAFSSILAPNAINASGGSAFHNNIQNQLSEAQKTIALPNGVSLMIVGQDDKIAGALPLNVNLIGQNAGSLIPNHSAILTLGLDAGLQQGVLPHLGDVYLFGVPIGETGSMVYASMMQEQPVMMAFNAGSIVFLAVVLTILGSVFWLVFRQTQTTVTSVITQATQAPASVFGSIWLLDRHKDQLMFTANDGHVFDKPQAFETKVIVEQFGDNFIQKLRQISNNVPFVHALPSGANILASKTSAGISVDADIVNMIELPEREKAADTQNIETYRNNMSEGLLLVDEKQDISFINQKFASYFGLKDCASLIGQPHEVLLEKMQDPSWKEFGRQTSKVGVKTQYFVENEDGSFSQICEELSENGQLEMKISDVTALVKTLLEQDAFKAALADDTPNRKEEYTPTLPKADHSLSMLSHQFLTPLNHIKGFAEAIQMQGQLDEKLEGYTRNIIDSSSDLASDIKHLIFHSDVHQEQPEFEILPTDMSELCSQVAVKWQAEAASQNIDVISDILCRDCICEIDEDAIMKLLDNVLDNAVKFSGENGQVLVRLRRSGEKCMISIADAGSGIEKSQIGRVFDAFEAGDEVCETTSASGLGLGLSTAKRVTELHNGSLRIKSRKEVGTMVLITLPLAKQSNEEGSMDIPNILGRGD